MYNTKLQISYYSNTFTFFLISIPIFTTISISWSIYVYKKYRNEKDDVIGDGIGLYFLEKKKRKEKKENSLDGVK